MTKERGRSCTRTESTETSHIDTVSPFSTKEQGPPKGGRVLSSANDAQVTDMHMETTKQTTSTLQPQVLTKEHMPTPFPPLYAKPHHVNHPQWAQNSQDSLHDGCRTFPQSHICSRVFSSFPYIHCSWEWLTSTFWPLSYPPTVDIQWISHV